MFLVYGPLIALGTYLVQRGGASAEVLAVSLPLGLLVAAFLWVNEFPDYAADRASNKRNLVVVLGRRRARFVFSALVAVAYFGILVNAWWFRDPIYAGAVLGLPWALAAARRVHAAPENVAQLIPAQVATLLAFCMMPVGMLLIMLLLAVVPALAGGSVGG